MFLKKGNKIPGGICAMRYMKERCVEVLLDTPFLLGMVRPDGGL